MNPPALIVRFKRRSQKRAIEKAAAQAGISASKFLIQAGLEKCEAMLLKKRAEPQPESQ